MKTFRNTTYLIKMIVSITLFIISFVLFLCDIMKAGLFIIVFLICLFFVINSAYNYYKTMFRFTNDKLIISYTTSPFALMSTKYQYQEILLKDIVSIYNKMDETRRYLCLIINTKTDKYIIKPNLLDTTIVKIINHFETLSTSQTKKHH
ncbi:MAG: hypothetical protein MR270_03195 [Erysipelotrichaceae bacterium]|nr:hypothetical protein [Erysipelotrichaceae bacterium]